MKGKVDIVKSLLIMIATVVCIDLCFARIADHFYVDRSITKFQYAMSMPDSIDWLIVGSSRASHHYDTPFIQDSIGIKVFNLGLDGRGLTYHEAAVKSYLQYHKPDTIILELLPDDLKGTLNNRIKILYPYMDANPTVEDVANRIDSDNKWLLKSHLLRYNSAILELTKSLMHPYNNSQLGYEPLEPNHNPDIKETIAKERGDIDETARQSLLEIIEVCRQNGVKLIIAYSPEYVIRDYDLPITEICDSLGVELLDFRDYRLEIPANEYFNDDYHLNRVGAREYTKQVIKELHR